MNYEIDDEYEDEKIDKSAAWLVDQMDPDNFTVIPEFGVMPQSVEWKGFMFPLVHPSVKDRRFAQSLREMLTTARTMARKRFDTVAEINRLAVEVLDLPESPLTERHYDAFMYFWIQLAIEKAASSMTSEKNRIAYLADAGATLSDWQSRNERTLHKTIAKSRASNGGRKSALKRGKERIDADSVVAAAKELGWPDKTYLVTKTLSVRFDRSTSFINRILAAARSNSI